MSSGSRTPRDGSSTHEKLAALFAVVLIVVASIPLGAVTLAGTAVAGNDPGDPTAAVSADGNEPSLTSAGNDAALFVGSAVTFDTSESSDDVGIDRYEWDFDGDGTTDLTTTNTTISHSYFEDGSYTATVTVVDTDGNTDTATVSVSVADAMTSYHDGPRNLGYYPNQTGPTTKPVPAWNISEGTPQVMQSIIVNGTLYTAFHDGGKLYALDPETGAVQWSATPGGSSGSTWTTPTYANGVLYLGSNDYKLHAVNATDGTEIWNYSTQTNVRSAPAVVDGVVYFGSNDGNMTAVNATTGEELWHYTLHQPVLVESNPAVVDGVVYFGADDDNVTALNATTGEKIWNYTLIDESQSDPTVANGTVFIGSDSTAGETSGDGQVYALNATTGEKIWNYTMTGDVDGGQVYADGILYAGSRGGDFVALNASDGSVVWNRTGADFRGAPVVVGNTVYVSDFGNGTVHAFDADDGTQVWEYVSPEGTLYPTPFVWNNYVYYGSGSHLWAIKQPAPSISNVAASNPSGQDVQISFDSDTQLSNISVAVGGAETATLTESDFTETVSGNTYTYTATYAGSSDGSYTASVNTAAGTEEVNGATGESASVTVDTTPPTASAVGTNTTVYVGSAVGFDTSGSSDNVGIDRYEWDFDGDGTTDLTTTNTTLLRSYFEAGTYTAEVTVVDGGGNTDTATVSVTVKSAMTSYHGGPRNLGYYPNQTGPMRTPAPAWNISEGTPQVMQSIIVNGTLYTAFHDGGKLYALDPETGDVKWSATPGGSSGSTWTTPAYANGVLYLGSNDYKLHAVDAATGTELWNYSTQTNVRSAPAVVDGVVYFGSNDGNMTAVNATTGEELWHHTLHQPVLVESNPAVVDGVVYFGADDDNVTALNATTGEKIWNYTLVDESQSDPTVANGTVFIGSDSTAGETSGDGQVYALNATTGEKLWNYTMTGDVDGGQVYADGGDVSPDGIVYAGSRGGDFVALNASNGSVIWNTTGVGFRGAPVVVGGVVYVSDFGNGTVHAFNATTGTQVWEYVSPEGTLYPTPLVWNDYVYYGSGSHLWAIKPSAPSLSNVAVSNPSGQDVQITFDSDTQLSNISVAVGGAETATLTEGDFTETASGGTYTYSYTYAGSSDGTYTATVETAADSSGADGASGESDSVLVDTTPPTADAGTNRSVPFDSAASFDATNSTDNDQIASYSWDFGDGNTSTGSTVSHTYGAAGEFTVTLTVTDASGNTDTDTITVTAEDTASPTAEAGSNQTVAEDTSVSFDGTSSTDNVGITSYTWEFGDGTTATGATPTHTYADPGTYTVTLDATDDNGNTDTDTVTVTVTDTTPPTADAGPNRSVPFDSAASFDGTNSTDNDQIASYSWDFGDGNTSTGSTVSHTYNTAGEFTVTLTVTDASGNTDTDTITVTAEDTASPTAEAGSNQTVAEDTSVSFDGTSSTDNVGITSYTWDFGDGSSSTGATPTHTYADPGNYTVTLTVSDNNGNTATDTVTVTVTDTTPPTAEAGSNQTVTEDTATTFDASKSTDNGQIASYSWDFGDGNTSTGVSPTHTYADPGNYTVTVTVTDADGNTDTDTLVVTVTDTTPPTAEAGSNQTVAEDTTATFDASKSTDNGQITSYSWDFGDGTTATGATATHTYADPGNYTATLTTTDAGGNTDTDTLVVTVTDTTAPDAVVSPSTATDGIGENISFTATGSTDNGEIVSYSWDFGDNTTASGATVSHAYDASGNYTVTLTVTDSAGNTNTTTANVTVEKDTTDPSVEVGGDVSVAFGDSVSFDADATDNLEIVSYSWDLGDGNTSTGPTVTHTYAEPGTYTVGVTVTDTGGNTATDTLIVTVNDTTAPTAAVGANRTVAEGDAVTFDASNATDNVGVTGYAWDFGDGTTATGDTVSHTYTSTGTYTVTVTVSDDAGNTDTATVTVTVEDRDAPTAELSLSDVSLFTDEQLELSAAGATDNENITSYEWTITTPSGTQNLTGETVTFDPTETGSYDVLLTLSDAAGNTATANASFTVGAAANLETNVSLGNVSDGVLLSNETLVVSASVRNTGDAATTQVVGLEVDGTVVATRTVSLNGSETATFTFRRSLSAGTYEIAVGDGEARTLEVKDPASISVTSFDVSETKLFTTEALLVNATVSNTGDQAGTTTVSLLVDGSVVQNRTVTVGADATKTITFADRFSAGEISVGVGDRQPTTVTVERPTNPDATVSITSPTAGAALDSGNLTISYTVENAKTGIAAVVYRIDGGSWQTVSTPLGSSLFTTPAVADGTHVVDVALRDNRGKIVATASRTVTVDTATPSLSVSLDKTANVSASNPATVSVTLSEQHRKSVTVELVSGGTVVDTTDITSQIGDGSETVTLDAMAGGSPLASGTYTVRVTATDQAGNSNTTTRTVEIDTESPTLSSLAVSGGTVTDGTRYTNETTEITVSGQVADVTSVPDRITLVAVANGSSFTMETVVDVSSNQSFSGTINLTDAPAGTYHVVVRATDSAGNEKDVELGSADRFRFDDTDPTVGVAIVPINATHGRVVVTSDESLDGVPTATVSGPSANPTISLSKNATGLEPNRYTDVFQFGTDGKYTASVTASDPAGNVGTANSATNVSTAIEVNDAGFLVIEAGNGTYIKLNLTTTVSNAVASLTASETPLRELSDGLSGTGFLEGVLGSTLSNSFSTAEVGIPQSEVTLPPGLTAEDIQIRRFNETSGQWEAVGTTDTGERTINGTTRQYFLVNVTHFSTYGALLADQNPPQITGTSSTPTEPSDGTYSYGTSSVTTTVSYTDDVTGVNTSAVRVLFDETPVSQLSNVTASITGSSTTVTASELTGSGTHNVTVVAVDEAGRSTRESVFYTVERDTAAPTLSTSLTNGTVIPYGTSSKTFTVDYSDALSGVNTSSVTVELNGSPVAASALSTTGSSVEYTLSDPTPGTSYTLVVTVADEEGNTERLTRTFSAEADTAGPHVTATSRTPSPPVSPSGAPPRYSHTTSAVTTTLSIADSLGGVNASAISVKFGPQGSLSDVTDSALVTTDQVSYSAVSLSGDTTYVLEATLVDNEGNTRTVTREFRVVTDTNAPNVSAVSYDVTPTSTSPTRFGPATEQLTLTLTLADGLGSVDTGQTSVSFGEQGSLSDVTENATISGNTLTLPVSDLSPGTTYEVAVTLTDDADNTNTSRITFSVDSGGSSMPPEAALSAPTATTVGELITFDASDSTDNFDIVAYDWDFDGDGRFERRTTSPTTTWRYEQAGEVNVTVTVIDGAGNTDTASTAVSVGTADGSGGTDDSTDTSGEASISVTSASLSTETVTAGEQLTVTVILENTGTERGSTTVEITLDGETVTTQTVTLDGGETKTVDLPVSPETAGESVVSVDGTLAGTLTVEAADDEDAGNGTSGTDTDEPTDDAGTDDGDGTDGDGTDGEGTDGDGTDGEGTDGDGTDGEGTDGDGTPTPTIRAEVSVDDQEAVDTVVVERAVLPAGGFVVVYDDAGTVVGVSEYLAAGVYEDVTVEVDPAFGDSEVTIVELHRDDGDQSFDAAADTAFESDGVAVSDTALINPSAVTDTVTATGTATATATPQDAGSATATATGTRTTSTTFPMWNLGGVVLLALAGLIALRRLD